jgi:tetratricopeptide (TPR) repeat protein
MARTIDDLQASRREMDARRSGSAPLSVTNTEEEVRPMSSADSEHPPLDRAALRDGYNLCVGNATRLVSDARVLIDAGRYRSAHLILLLALEELGSAVQLYEAGRAGVQDWEAWWHRYSSHPKDLESTPLGIPRMEEANERFTQVYEELLYVEFDKNDGRFKAPRLDEDSELRELLDKEAAYAEEVLKALPPHAFERWEFQELAQRSPGVAPSVLYARIEEILFQEPAVSERNLLTAVALDLGRSPDDFAAGFGLWKEVAPKARVYLDLLRRVQHRMKKSTTGGADPFTVNQDTFSKGSEEPLPHHPPDARILSQTSDGVDSDKQGRLATKHRADGEALERDERIDSAPAAYQEAPSPMALENPMQVDAHTQELTNRVGDAGTLDIQGEAQQERDQAADGVASDRQSVPAGTETITAQERILGRFIQVRYQNTRAGQVDDITLDELIESKRISHFFRPAEDKWVDISVDPVRVKGQTNTTGHARRASDGEEQDREGEKPGGFFRSLFKSPTRPAVEKRRLTAPEWFEQGYLALHTTNNCEEAARAFAHAIRLDPIYERAYVNRALAYERLGNMQQAIEDYSRAVLVKPDDTEVYYLRGLAFKQLGMDAEATTDLMKAADLGFRPAYDFLKSILTDPVDSR